MVGVFNRPAGPESRRYPAVLFLHGFPGSEKNVDIQRELLKRGVASFSLHFAGAWGSEGYYRVSALIDEARAGLKFLKSHDCVDLKRLGVFGFSMGGWTALHVGAREPGLRTVVAVAPAGGKEMVVKNLRQVVAHLSVPLRVKSKADAYRDFVAAVRAHDPAQSAARLGGSLLLVHGTADTVIHPAVSARIFASAPQPKKLVRAQGARHDFLDRREWLTRLVADWFCETLPVRRG